MVAISDETLIISEFLVLLLFTGFLVYRYASKKVPWHSWISVFLTWSLCFSIVALVPIDIYYTLNNEKDIHSIQSKRSFVYNTWLITYWITFFLTWLILPFLQEYENAGDFTKIDKVKRSIKVNLYSYAITLTIGVVYTVYYFVNNKFNWQQFMSTVIALSHSFGILLITLLLGYGLVNVPRQFWNLAKQDLMLKYYQYQASAQEESKTTSGFELEDEIKVPEAILNQCKDQLNILGIQDVQEIKEINLETIVNLNSKVKKYLAELQRTESRWELIIEQALFLEDIIKSSNEPEYKINSIYISKKNGLFGKIISFMQWLWYTKIKVLVCLVLFVLLSLFSLLVIVGEIFQFSNVPFNFFTQISQAEAGFLYTQAICLVPLIYISLCVYYGLFSMKLSGYFGLYYHHLTDSPSLIFASVNFSRVTAPICFNFLSMAFGNLKLVPIIGESFPTYFPIALVLLCIFNVFDIFGKIMRKLGLSQFSFDSDYSDEKIEQGQKLLDEARKNHERRDISISLGDFNLSIGKLKNPLISGDYESKRTSVSYGSDNYQRKSIRGSSRTSKRHSKTRYENL